MKARLLRTACFLAGAILAYFAHSAYGGRWYATRYEGLRLDRMTGRLEGSFSGTAAPLGTYTYSEFK